MLRFLLIIFMGIASPVRADIYAALPPVKPLLANWDVSSYAKIFDAQERGEWVEADAAIKKLANGLLMGHVLGQRYLHHDYKAGFDELRQWLDLYYDHPQAEKLYKLAVSRRPEGSDAALREPEREVQTAGILGLQGTQAKQYRTKKKRGESLQRDVNNLFRQVRGAVDRYEPTRAMSLLNGSQAGKELDPTEYDQVRALIAAGYIYAQKPDEALTLAVAARKRSTKYVPLAYWVEGLVHWQRDEYGKAAFAFEKAASSPYASGWLQAAASYWTARSYMRAGDVKTITPWLKKAARNPRTFYGLLATRALGQNFRFDWEMPVLNPRHIKLLEKYPQGQRAKALIDAGQYTLAEEELKAIPGVKKKKDVQEALLAYAFNKNLSGLLHYLGNTVPRAGGGLYDGALFPLIPWEPEGGYNDDIALMHAFIRQESRFRVSAESASGALGLMQIMPSTAAWLTKDDVYKETRGKAMLKHPTVNIDIGLSYLHHLLELKVVDGNMLYLALAYNAGPGKLGQWKKEREQLDDPLMFIETIPFAETRNFVERVMANYWIYQMRLGEVPTTLDALAEGKWPTYENL